MEFRYFAETENERIYQDEFDKYININCIQNKTDIGILLKLEISNSSLTPLYIKKCGIEICNVNIGNNSVVFIDPGKCAWGGVKRLDYLDDDPRMCVIEEQRITYDTIKNVKFHRSDLQTVVYAQGEAVLVGFISQSQGNNKIDIYPASGNNSIKKIEAWQSFEVSLMPNDCIHLDGIIISKGDNPYALLENYADSIKEHHKKVFEAPPITGMMTWYGYHTAVTEDIVLENAKIISEFFSGYPQSSDIYMILDHGWQSEAEWGLLENDKERFPHGIKWLSNELNDIGVKFGIWHTPFCITEFTDNYKELEPLMVLDENDCPKLGLASVWSSFNIKNRGGRRQLNYFDGANFVVQKRWEDEMEQLKNWGAEYCKMDFFALKKGFKSGLNLNNGQLYKNSWNSFRKGFGESNHIAPCSCDTNMQLGYCDSIRIASDIGEAGLWPGADTGYKYGHSTIAAMWYKNRKFWVNDADSIQIAKGCSMGEARIRATTVALSGGHVMLSEDLRKVNDQRLDMIKRILPPMKKTAIPLNLFENPFPEGYPSVWCLDSDWDYGPKKIIALFNFDRNVQEFVLTSDMFGISSEEEYIVLEWWNGKWLGQFSENVKVDVPSEDCAVLHAVQVKKVPEVLSVSHHISGGYILSDMSFNEKNGQLSGVIETKKGLKIVLYGYTPENWSIPGNTRAHVIKNKIGGWQMEIETTGHITPFSIVFEKVN